MNNLWEQLACMQVKVHSASITDESMKARLEDLNRARIHDAPKNFYAAVDSVELGCGFTRNNDGLTVACQQAVHEDSDRLLRVLLSRERRLDVLSVLQRLPTGLKLCWVRDQKLSSPAVNYECIRQLLQAGLEGRQAQEIMAKGLADLAESDGAAFSVLLGRFFLYSHTRNVGLFVSLMKKLTETGWASLGKAFPWDYNPAVFAFLNECSQRLSWEAVARNASTFLEAWFSHLDACLKSRKFGQRLICSGSNLLVPIIHITFASSEAFQAHWEEALVTCESLMYEWYESIMQQRAVLLVCLCKLYHFCYAWIDQEQSTFLPEHLRQRTQLLIMSWRFLWDNPLEGEIRKEIEEILSAITSGNL